MTQKYNVFGRQIGSHYLAMITLGTLFGTGYAFAGGSKKAPAASPPINAASSDEADFIKKFIESADEGKKEAAAKH